MLGINFDLGEDIEAVLEEIATLEQRAHELLGEPAVRKKNLAKR